VAPKAAKWALVGPVLTACGGQKKAAYPTFQTVSRRGFLGSPLVGSRLAP
jgi:hypothetical protein